MKPRKRVTVPKDPKKESIFKELAERLEASGYTVRREKLKAGPGWKAISGACRVEDKKLIFVDPRLPQDDQILFLRGKAEAAATAVEHPTPS